MKSLLIFGIRFYQKSISPFLGKRCRFYPPCSEYAEKALSQKGLFRGAALLFWRILRCSPFSSGGFDPVE